ncbi:hypothetical protein ALC62_00339, partial [Cyphomyrmex costatus]
QHSPGYLAATPRPGTTVRPESKSRIRILQASRRPGSIRDAQREPAEEGTGAYRKMQASIILQGRSVRSSCSPSLGLSRKGASLFLSTSFSYCGRSCFLSPSSSSFSFSLLHSLLRLVSRPTWRDAQV